jgi:hypothetical protein
MADLRPSTRPQALPVRRGRPISSACCSLSPTSKSATNPAASTCTSRNAADAPCQSALPNSLLRAFYAICRLTYNAIGTAKQKCDMKPLMTTFGS